MLISKGIPFFVIRQLPVADELAPRPISDK